MTFRPRKWLLYAPVAILPFLAALVLNGSAVLEDVAVRAQNSLFAAKADWAKLTFDARYELERNRDRVALEVRRPGGEWSLLESYTGNSAWTRHQLDLSSMDGGQAQLRFVFTSDESVQFDGFSLDRVVVSA